MVNKTFVQMMEALGYDWYVIEEANIDGIVIWQNLDGAVYQTAPGLRTEKIADSFADYISCQN